MYSTRPHGKNNQIKNLESDLTFLPGVLFPWSHLPTWWKTRSHQVHYIPVRCAPVLAVLAVMHAFCLRPDYRYLVCRIATYLSVFYNPIAICSKLSVYCYFVRNCLCVGILFKIALVFAAKTIMLEHCPIFVVFVVTYT